MATRNCVDAFAHNARIFRPTSEDIFGGMRHAAETERNELAQADALALADDRAVRLLALPDREVV